MTTESERVLPREPYLASPVSLQSQSPRSGWDEGPYVFTCPSSVTLTDTSPTSPRTKTRPRGFTDVGLSSSFSDLGHSTTDQNLSPHNNAAPRVVVRQPSSTKLHPLRPPTAPPAIELPPAPESAQREEFALLAAFPERTTHSAASSSSSLSFASSTSSKFDPVVPDGRRRDVRRLKNSKKSIKSRPTSPSNDANLDVQDRPSKPTTRREFSPTRTLRKAISIQNLRSQGNSAPSPILPPTEDTKPLKKQRSFHHTRILIPPFPASLKYSHPSPGRDALPVPDERDSAQLLPKLPLTLPVTNPMRVRERLFSGSSSRRHASLQPPGPDEETQSICSLHSTCPRPHTAIPVNRSSVPNKPELSSFWDEEGLNSPPATGNESQEYGPQQILSAADILKIENMVRDGENLNGFVRSHKNSITSIAALRTAPEPARAGLLSPPPTAQRLDSSQAINGKLVTSDRQRSRGISLQGKVGNSTNQALVSPSPTLSARSLSFQPLSALSGLPVPPRLRSRPSTSSEPTSPTEYVRSSGAGDRSSVILKPLSPPPIRRSTARRILDPPPPSAPMKPAISRKPSFLDMWEDPDRELSPPENSFLDMGKASLDTVRSSTDAEKSDLS